MMLLLAVLTALPSQRRVEIRYQADLPASSREVDLWIPLASDDPQQRILSVRIEHGEGAEVVHDERYGNAALHLRRRGPASVIVTYVVARLPEQHALSGAPVQPTTDGVIVSRFLQPDKLGSLIPAVLEYEKRATAGKRTPLDKARAIYDFVVATMRYDKSGTGWGHGDIVWACDAKRGNCTDFHTLFVAMARAAGIPARFEIGLPLPDAKPGGAGDIPGYHCWARFWLDGLGWIPIDASEAKKQPEKQALFFGGHDTNRVQFTIGRDLRFPGMAHELNYFIHPYAEQQGKPVEVAHHYSYRDLP
jgi:transglutaminase-like putative cysteine protease